MGLVKSCGGVRTGFVSFVGFFLLYRRMWQPRGSAPKGGDEIMAVMIRFLAIARDVSRAG